MNMNLPTYDEAIETHTERYAAGNVTALDKAVLEEARQLENATERLVSEIDVLIERLVNVKVQLAEYGPNASVNDNGEASGRAHDVDILVKEYAMRQRQLSELMRINANMPAGS